MTKQEKEFNQEVWYVLGKIETERVVATNGKPIEYEFLDRQVLTPGVVTPDREKKILYKLQEWGALKIREDPFEPPESTPYLFYLDLIHPKYEEFYKKFQKACDIDAYLNEYQNKLYKGKKPSDFQKVDLSKLALRPTFVVPDENPAIRELTAKDIADEFSERNYDFVLMVLQGILTLSEFGTNNKVQYQLQSDPGSELVKERLLLKKFELYGMFKNLGEDGLMGIVSLIEVNIKLVRDVVTCLEDKKTGVMSEEEFKEIKQSKNPEPEEEVSNPVTNTKSTPLWIDDFHWEGKKFVFGKYGNTSSFNSKDRKSLFNELTKAKGDWVTVRKLREVTKQNDAYVRPTIGQIENSWSKELRKHISIPATDKDDLFPKPEEGAYRIKFMPNPL